MNLQEAIEVATAAHDSIHKLLTDTELNTFLFAADDYYQLKVGKLTDAQYVLTRIRQLLMTAKELDDKDKE